MKKIAIIIVHYSGKENTINCIDSVKKLKMQTYKPLVVVVDNNSKERLDLPQSVKKLLSGEIKILSSEKNLGFSGGNNLGIAYAINEGVEYILILNNDTFVDPFLIEELLRAEESNENVGIVAPKIYFAKGYEFHKDRYKKEDFGKVIWYAGGEIDWSNIFGKHRGVDEVDLGQYGKTESTEFASGCCFLIKKDVLEKVGFFDDKYFLYYEDADLCMRVKNNGYDILYAPKAVLWHKNASASGGSGSKLQDYYITRNRMLFGIRYATFRTKFALIRQSIRLFFFGRHWQKKGIVDFYLRRFGKGSYS